MNFSEIPIEIQFANLTIKVISVIKGRCEENIPSHCHGNNSYEIHYIYKGNGKLIMDENVYDLYENVLYVTGPHINHEQITFIENPMEEYCINLSIKENKKNNSVAREEAKALTKLFVENTFWYGVDKWHIEKELQQLIVELENKSFGFYCSSQSLLSQFIIKVVRNYKVEKNTCNTYEKQTLDDNRLLLIERLFLTQYETLSLRELASKIGLSQRQTQRILNEHYSKSFREKKIEARLSAAKTLLVNNSYTISEISIKTGFSSPQYFSKAFKKYFKQYPTEYRKNY